jgi:hypothetical protein
MNLKVNETLASKENMGKLNSMIWEKVADRKNDGKKKKTNFILLLFRLCLRWRISLEFVCRVADFL